MNALIDRRAAGKIVERLESIQIELDDVDLEDRRVEQRAELARELISLSGMATIYVHADHCAAASSLPGFSYALRLLGFRDANTHDRPEPEYAAAFADRLGSLLTELGVEFTVDRTWTGPYWLN